MKNILVIGATGQIGSELTLELRKRYGDDHVVAGYIPSAMPQGELKASGPSAIADVTDRQSIEVVARQFKIDTIYNLAALLSVVAESRPAMAWKVGIDGLWNVLEVAREYGCAVFTPSSIGSFGESTPHVKTPQDTIQRPRTMYGVTKVTTELLSDYYYTKYGVDTRAVRFPGIISNVTPPGGGTTDYAVDIYYSAVKGEKFICPIKEGTYMFEAVNSFVTSVNGIVWGWGMIALLLGTHVFLTIRTGFIQRKTITKGIPLSVDTPAPPKNTMEPHSSTYSFRSFTLSWFTAIPSFS